MASRPTTKANLGGNNFIFSLFHVYDAQGDKMGVSVKSIVVDAIRTFVKSCVIRKLFGNHLSCQRLLAHTVPSATAVIANRHTFP